MTIRVLDYRGDGAYYLRDAAHELDGLREGPPGRVLAGSTSSVPAELDGLLAGALPDGRRALDLVVAAPKPVSLLLATEPAAVARRVVALHERSVDSAVTYVLDEALGDSPGPRVMAFTHGVNRGLDPHLHSHVLVGTHDQRGARIALGQLRAHVAAADALYLADLRAGLARAAGRAAWLTLGGVTVVEGVDPGLVAHASAPRTRDGRVEHGGAKRHPSRDEVLAHWRRLLATHVAVGLEVRPPEADERVDEYRFAVALGTGLVRRRDVVRAWASACPRGETSAVVRLAAGLATPGLEGDRRVHSAVVRDAPGVRVLGARPRDPAGLMRWRDDRAALEHYLAAGHRLSHAIDPRGASASTRLALAAFDVARTPSRRRPGLDRALRGADVEGRSIS